MLRLRSIAQTKNKTLGKEDGPIAVGGENKVRYID